MPVILTGIHVGPIQTVSSGIHLSLQKGYLAATRPMGSAQRGVGARLPPSWPLEGSRDLNLEPSSIQYPKGSQHKYAKWQDRVRSWAEYGTEWKTPCFEPCTNATCFRPSTRPGPDW